MVMRGGLYFLMFLFANAKVCFQYARRVHGPAAYDPERAAFAISPGMGRFGNRFASRDFSGGNPSHVRNAQSNPAS